MLLCFGNTNYRATTVNITAQQFLEHGIDVIKTVRIKEYPRYSLGTNKYSVLFS